MPETDLAAIAALGLVKQYGRHRAVNEIDFTLGAGKTLALIGHNGAGKTTLMKLILGLIRPSAGSLNVLGVEPAAAPLEHRRSIGFLPRSVFTFSPSAIKTFFTFNASGDSSIRRIF